MNKRRPFIRTFWSVLSMGLIAFCSSATQALPPLPQHDGAVHVGVQSCASSTCHDADEPSALAVVEQNEYRIWKEHDRHARAFESLQSERAELIARQLDLGKPTEASLCLSCHSNYVPEERRGRMFQLSDGVSCEACHGGAQDWMGIHSSGVNEYPDNVEAGMYPTADPDARARLCLSCHQGTPDKPVNHRLYSAGHPRLALELDTFTMARPAHHVEDHDYRQRKPDQAPLRVWALGQILAAQGWRELHGDTEVNPPGHWPDWGFYNCFGCHRSVDAPGGSGDGNPRFDISRLLMVQIALAPLDEALSGQLAEVLGERSRITDRAGGEDLLGRADPVLDRALALAVDHEFDVADARQVMTRLASLATSESSHSYEVAEQMTYAAGVVVEHAAREDDAYRSAAVEGAVDALYEAAGSGPSHDPAAWRAAFRQLQQAFARASD